jgi:hydroxymethylpyrimidine/phosphomethylpyrimidine kinase
MSETRVLVIGSVDPTGRAGVARDLAVLDDERVAAAMVVAGLTVQDANHVSKIVPTDSSLFRESLRAATEDAEVHAIKLGLLPNDAIANETADFLGKVAVPVVFDPVLFANHGFPLTVDNTLSGLRRIAACATLITPNIPEAEALTGLPGSTPDERLHAAEALRKAGARWVLMKGGHGSEDPIRNLLVGEETRTFTFPRLEFSDHRAGRGKGCELASRVAASLARGIPVDWAVERALGQLQARLGREVSQLRWDVRTDRATRLYEHALGEFLCMLQPACVPEVGMNLAYAPATCDSLDSVVGLAGRITIAGDSFAVTGRPWPGGPHHTGRIAHAAQRRLGKDVWVFNHRYDASLPGLRCSDHVALDRGDEPSAAPSSMEWMVETAIDRLGRLPALLSDRGAPGKEPMVRVLAHTPQELFLHHAVLHAGDQVTIESRLSPAKGIASPFTVHTQFRGVKKKGRK